MNIALNGKNYILPKPNLKVTRYLIDMQEGAKEFNAESFDKMVEFVVVAFRNQFTVDDVMEELSMTEFTAIFEEISNAVMGQTNKGAEGNFQEVGA